jgi:tetratricopeptide (TPR) repeat protein
LQDRVSGEGRPDQLPNRDWNQVREDWQNHRDEIRQDWQDYRDQAREDWQGWADDHYPWYGGWYGGYASGYWGRWDYLWDQHPVAATVGLTWWGANALGYTFGTGDYYNPYYDSTTVVNYAEPIVTAPIESAAQATAPATAAPPDGVSKFDEARAAFSEKRYDAALALTNEAVAKMPRDAVLHEFRSLVLFALGKYHEAAAAVHAVLAVGPGWDWKTLSGLYADIDTYAAQLRALENYAEQHPDAADAHFLLGYHYLTCGYLDPALTQFRRVAQLQPKDTVTPSLVATLSPPGSELTLGSTSNAPPAVPADQITGSWTAKGKGNSVYTMNLLKDGTFAWAFARGSRKEQVKGVHTLEGNVLALEPESGGVMLAELTAKGPDTLLFKSIGGSGTDPGLEFQRDPRRE